MTAPLARFDPVDIPLPPEGLRDVGRGDFRRVGRNVAQQLVRLGDLAPDERVLDVGSGAGRVAAPLTRYLRAGYEGLEVMEPYVRWCRENITSRYPSFKFVHADVRNGRYNPDGKHAASDYRFPYEASSFDFVFLASVFTHMLPEDAANYLREVARVLRPGGRCFATFFLLNPESESFLADNRSRFSFQHPISDGCRAQNRRHLEGAVACPESLVRDRFRSCGLGITALHLGNWCGRESRAGQDVVLAVKAADPLPPDVPELHETRAEPRSPASRAAGEGRLVLEGR